MILAPMSVLELLRCSEVSRLWHQAVAAMSLKRKVHIWGMRERLQVERTVAAPTFLFNQFSGNSCTSGTFKL